jgi:hypothetical protein
MVSSSEVYSRWELRDGSFEMGAEMNGIQQEEGGYAVLERDKEYKDYYSILSRYLIRGGSTR